jgi:uncharacterized SAM-binding protein YcdF (DUF218 family)
VTEVNSELLAQQIWDYCNFRTPLVRSDGILVLCSHDIRIAEYAAKIFLEGWAPKLIFSGGLSPFTSKIYSSSEAEAFREIAIAERVPAQSIFIEDKSTNTQENLEFSFKLLNEKQSTPSKIILVQKPNMLRRVFATATKLFPDIEFSVSSHDIAFQDAPHRHLSKEMLIHELVGDLQRLITYADKGFINPQNIPLSVYKAYMDLKALGYTGNLTI